VRFDLSKFCGTSIEVIEVDTFLESNKYMLYNRAVNLDSLSKNFGLVENYKYNPVLLNEGIYRISQDQQIKRSFFTDNLRSNCEITNQPDFGRILIQYTTDGFDINTENLLRYIVSFRNHQEFHEPTCERIYNDLFTILKPKHLLVLCQYTRRGGIDINPYRTTQEQSSLDYYNLPKLLQQ
jgi:7-cyano-7-deazaguanine reductase